MLRCNEQVQSVKAAGFLFLPEARPARPFFPSVNSRRCRGGDSDFCILFPWPRPQKECVLRQSGGSSLFHSGSTEDAVNNEPRYFTIIAQKLNGCAILTNEELGA